MLQLLLAAALANPPEPPNWVGAENDAVALWSLCEGDPDSLACQERAARTRHLVSSLGQGCGAAVAWACRELGNSLISMHATDQERSRGDQALARGCTLGDRRACGLLGDLRSSSLYGGEQDYAGAIAAWEQGCLLEDGRSCGRMAAVFSTGGLGERDLGQAARLHVLACSYGYTVSCGDAAFYYAHGEGVPEDSAQALRLARAGCILDDGRSCMVAADLGPEDDREEFVLRACAMGTVAGCVAAEDLVDEVPDLRTAWRSLRDRPRAALIGFSVADHPTGVHLAAGALGWETVCDLTTSDDPRVRRHARRISRDQWCGSGE